MKGVSPCWEVAKTIFGRGSTQGPYGGTPSPLRGTTPPVFGASVLSAAGRAHARARRRLSLCAPPAPGGEHTQSQVGKGDAALDGGQEGPVARLKSQDSMGMAGVGVVRLG